MEDFKKVLKESEEKIYLSMLKLHNIHKPYMLNVKKIENKLYEIDKKLDDHDQRVEKIEQKLNEHDQRFDKIDQRFENLEAKMDKRFNRMEDDLSLIKHILIGMVKDKNNTLDIVK